MAQRKSDVAGELVQQAHLLLVEEIALARIKEQHAGAFAGGEERQGDERAALRVVPDKRARPQLQAREIALGAALARVSDLANHSGARLGEPDRGKAKAALLHRDAAG